MQPPPEIEDVLAYFMTEYLCDSNPCLLEVVVKDFLMRTLNEERATQLCEKYLAFIQDRLVDEFNDRYGTSQTLRFKLLDDEGTKIGGIGDLILTEKVAFQDALNSLSASQFEGLSALVLRHAGCSYLRRTPESHDQGIDAFGYMDFFKETAGLIANANLCRVAFLAQAKHYSESRIGSKDIREFAGTHYLSLHRIYSTIDKRYDDLELLPYSPAALILITSGEIPATVKRLGARSGIIVLSSDDLHAMFVSSLDKKPIVITKSWLIDEWITQMEGIPIAK